MRFAIQYNTGELVTNSCDQVIQFSSHESAQSYLDETVDCLIRRGYATTSEIVSKSTVIEFHQHKE